MSYDWDHLELRHQARLTDDAGDIEVEALLDLHERVKELEGRRFIKVEQYSANGPEEMVDIIDLRDRVNRYGKWVEQCEKNWIQESSGHSQAMCSLQKLKELGLFGAGGQGGAAHQEKDPMREAMLAGYRLSTWAASISWDGAENLVAWLAGLKERILDVQEKCKAVDPGLVETMKVRVDLPESDPSDEEKP
jgi:hypothetical protein